MIKNLIQAATLLLLLVAVAGWAPQDKPVVLKGLDPVELVSGKQVQGRDDLFVERGGFRYLFASEESKKKFEQDPKVFEIQNKGCCPMDEGMPGKPDLFIVYKGKIYLAGTPTCEQMIKSDPAAFFDAKKVAIMIFPGVQIIDYTGPFEVFGQAGYDVYTVSETNEPLKTSMGMEVVPKYTFEDCPKPDIVVLPGGRVPDIGPDSPKYKWIQQMSQSRAYIMSVCNGAFWLANTGLLGGKEATTYYGYLDRLQKRFPDIQVHPEKRFTDNGQIMCTAGLSSGIDGALRVVAKLDGDLAARSIALNMEYNWQPDSDYARGAFADMLFKKVAPQGIPLPEGTKTDVVAFESDKDHCVKAWHSTLKGLTPATVMEGVVKQFSTAWTKASAESNGHERTTWTFTDANGKAWKADVVAERDAKDADSVLLTLKIERA